MDVISKFAKHLYWIQTCIYEIKQSGKNLPEECFGLQINLAYTLCGGKLQITLMILYGLSRWYEVVNETMLKQSKGENLEVKDR